MTILQALDSYYHRLDGVAEPGWSKEPIGFVILLDKEGGLVDVEVWAEPAGKKTKPKIELVPKWFGRSGSGSTPFFLWDNSGYALGVSKKEGGKVARDHAAFVEWHRQLLAESHDEGLVALRKFLESWQPDQFVEPRFTPDFLDQNVAFRLYTERTFIHQRPAARQIIQQLTEPAEDAEEVLCLVTGEKAPGARLHPKIKNVDGTASAEVPLVSFNNDAFESYNQKQGENAPTSQAAAFRYGAALNHLLTRGGPHRVRRQIGDATVVFWADASGYNDASGRQAAEAAEFLFGGAVDPSQLEREAAFKLAQDLEAVRKGKAAKQIINVDQDDVVNGLKYYILGLSPNAARLSVRFWETVDFVDMVDRLSHHYHDLQIEPSPWRTPPSVNFLLARTTALQEKPDNIPRLLAGEVMRAILSGTRYPQSLLAAAIMRLRAGDNAASGWHAAVIRAVLFRDQRLARRDPDIPERGETPMSLKRDHDNPGYQLGRLFAVYELAQRSALGRVNATIRDKYFGAASATPASVFPLIVRGAQPHLAKVRKEKPGWGHLIERELEEITGRFNPDAGGTWPRSLRLKDQGEFAIGYYHQRATKLGDAKGDQIGFDDVADTNEEGDEE
jgi:CRISPR-associated protein Csd1